MPTAKVPVLETLQEYADSRGVSLSVDAAAGVIKGVKILGRSSPNAGGREYPADVMRKAIPLYEGRRVNVDHPADQKQRRSYRDRIGAIKNVQLREDGLYGDFHYNPKHALAEQLAWDAQNAPENVGFSHNAQGPTKIVGGKRMVEAIDRVLSVDLVADPATTRGLFESLEEGEIADKIAVDEALESLRDVCRAAQSLISQATYDETLTTAQAKKTRILQVLADWQAELKMPTASGIPEGIEMEYKDLTLDGIKAHRPDLLTSLQESLQKSDETKTLQESLTATQAELATLKADKAQRELQEAIVGELKAGKLDPSNKGQVSEVFMEQLLAQPDASKRKALIEDRAGVVKTSGPQYQNPPRTAPPAQPLMEGRGAGQAAPSLEQFSRSLRSAVA